MFNVNKFKKNIKFITLLLIIIGLGIIFSLVFNSTDIHLEEGELAEDGNISTNKVIISEVMTSNKGAVADTLGNTYDWLEIYNGKDHEINLKNYALSDAKNKIKWVFPETFLESNSYLIVYLAGINAEGLYTNFKLKSSGGEDLVLINPSGKIIDGITTASLNKNEVMYRDNDGNWKSSKSATPGFANTKEGLAEYERSIISEENELIITEILPKNKGNFITKNNDYSGYIELTNNSKEKINLNGYTIGADLTRPYEYKLPDYELKAGESIAIFTSGKNEIYENEIHASFKLTNENGKAVLAKGNKVVSIVEYNNLPNGIALIKVDGEFEKNNTISPGYANTTEGINKFSKEYLQANKTLIINEVMNSNGKYLPHNGNSYYDWIELYNNSKETINLNEYYLTTNLDNMEKWQLPKVELKSGEYYVIMASGDTNLSTTKYKHANFKVSDIEAIYLNKNDKTIDSMFVANIPLNYSMGRGEYGLYYYATPTPLEKNGTGKREISYAPKISKEAGVYDNVKSVEVSLNSHGTIYYTLDGSVPTTSSKLYKGPISLTKTTVLKATSYEDGKYKSNVETSSYIINENHTMDVLMVSMEPSEFNELMRRRWEFDIEKLTHAEFFPKGEKEGFEIDCGIRLYGGNNRSAGVPNGLALRFRKKYGAAKLNYQVFENRDYSTYNSLLLRSGVHQGNELDPLRDTLMTSLLDGKTSVLVQANRPVILYINGNYWGLYTFRERIDRNFIGNNLNVTANDSNTNIIKIDGEVRSGSRTSYNKMLNYLNSTSLSNQENYEYAKTLINVQDIADYWLAETWVTNHDIVNVRYYQNTEFDNNRWHAIFFDLDNALFNVDHNYISFATDPGGMHSSGTYYSTTILRSLMKNKEFKDLYLKRMAYLLKDVFSEERFNEYLDNLIKLYEPEIKRHYSRWNRSYSSYTNEISKLKTFASKREKYMLAQAKAYFGLSSSEMERYFGDI